MSRSNQSRRRFHTCNSSVAEIAVGETNIEEAVECDGEAMPTRPASNPTALVKSYQSGIEMVKG